MAKRFLIASILCVTGAAEICHAGVGDLSSPGSLRGSRTISSPGSQGTLGTGAGIGNLYRSPQGRGVLSTSVNRAPNYNALRTNQGSHNSNAMRSNISRSSTPARITTGTRRNAPARTTDISKIPRVTASRGKSTRARKAPQTGTATPAGAGAFQSSINRSAQPALAGASYVAALGGNVIPQNTQAETSITTLVPKYPGIYQKKMQQAETAFRNREFRSAISHYNMAADLSNNSPESLLGLMLSYFAVSDGGYELTGLYLRKTLECFPELPLVDIDMDAFYFDPVQYRRDLGRLIKYAKANPDKPDVQLVLGYFMWRDGELKKSREALTAAMENSHDEALNEAIDTLWSGMVASGKVSGKLQAETPKKTDKTRAKRNKDEKKSSPLASPDGDKPE